MTRRSVDVRRATAADVEHLLGLAVRARTDEGFDRPSAHPDDDTRREHLLAALDRRGTEVHLALADDDAVGALVLRVADLMVLTGGTTVHIEQLYVCPTWRHRGVARQLLAAAVAAGERHGAEDVACVLPPGGRDLQRFFARLGFAPLVTLRAVPVSRLRARLAGPHVDGRRRIALDQLVARRRRQLERGDQVLPPAPVRAAVASLPPSVPAPVPAISGPGRPAAGR